MGELEVRQESLKKLEFEQQREENVRIYYQNLVLKLKNVSELKEEYEKKLRNIYDELNIEYKPQVSSTETGIMENDEHFQAFCVSTVVSGIIDKKKKELDKLQYPYELHIEFQDDWKIEMMDISRLLNNMLDNAMDAVANYLEETQNKGRLKGNYIFGISYIEDDFLTIEIKNIKSPNQNLVEKDGKYISSKKKKEGHGYGLQIIGRIAAKYDGKMEISESEEYFINKVILKIK
jgi:sensor histidine kinase regulating citrate/malate metabolism